MACYEPACRLKLAGTNRTVTVVLFPVMPVTAPLPVALAPAIPLTLYTRAARPRAAAAAAPDAAAMRVLVADQHPAGQGHDLRLDYQSSAGGTSTRAAEFQPAAVSRNLSELALGMLIVVPG
jgi:hypothetical protein